MSDLKIFRLAVGAFALVALWPVLGSELLPMQDYPKHLFHAQLLQAERWPEMDFDSYYVAFLIPGPYTTFLVLAGLLSQVVSLELAGRLVVATSVLLIAAFAWSTSGRDPAGNHAAPWGLLLLFPLMFSQFWYLGFVNYMLSLPMLLFALRQQERLAADPGRGGLIGLFMWLAAIFFTHPYTLLVYVVLGTAGGLTSGWKPAERAANPEAARRHTRVLLASLGIRGGFALLLVGWLVLRFSIEGPPTNTELARWLSPGELLQHALMTFTGLRWEVATIDPLSLVLWLAILVLCAASRWREPAPNPSTVALRRRLVLFVALCAAGFLILPFGIKLFNYFNVRLVAPAYLLLGWLAGTLRFDKRTRLALALLSALVLGRSVSHQLALSRETAELAPLLERMRPNARLLPLVFDNDSQLLDSLVFDPHLHDYCYYHIRVGGGFSPYLFRATVQPVGYRPGAARPAPGEYTPYDFRLEQHAADYDYFLVRSAPPLLAAYLAPIAEPAGRSGKWQLFARLPANPPPD